MTITTYTGANCATIKQYEADNKAEGVKLVVDRSDVLGSTYAGKSKPPAVSYSEQISNWKAGFTLNRVESTGCTPKGWYWVKYKAQFTAGKESFLQKYAVELVALGVAGAVATAIIRSKDNRR